LFLPQSSGSSLLSKQELWRHFYTLIRTRGFRPPATDESSFATSELPSPRPCEYPEDSSEEIEVAKRCGKPYANTVEADRFALSAESLQQSQTPVRVTAGFLRQSVFKAFFSYLLDSISEANSRDPPENNIDIQNHGEQLTRGDVGGNVIAIQDMNVNSGGLTQSPLAVSTALSRNAVVVAPAADQPPSFCIMKVTVGGATRSLCLPIHEAFFNDFSSGLFSNNFNVQQMDGRSITPGRCYWHYLESLSSQLHAVFRKDQYPTHHSTSTRMGTGSERGRIRGHQQMARAKIWLQEQVSRL
jgi:hypothetical protein